MSERRIFQLSHAIARSNAVRAVQDAPEGFMVRIGPPTRSLEQNALLWSRLSDLAAQVEWYGRFLSAEDWKHVMTAALSKQDVVPGIDGGFVVLGKSTSRMTKRELGELLDLIDAFGSQRGVAWTLGAEMPA